MARYGFNRLALERMAVGIPLGGDLSDEEAGSMGALVLSKPGQGAEKGHTNQRWECPWGQNYASMLKQLAQRVGNAAEPTHGSIYEK